MIPFPAALSALLAGPVGYVPGLLALGLLVQRAYTRERCLETGEARPRRAFDAAVVSFVVGALGLLVLRLLDL